MNANTTMSSTIHYSPTTVYTEIYWKGLGQALALISMLILGGMITRRAPSWRDVVRWEMTGVRVATFGLLVDSALYIFISSVLLFGVGTSISNAACHAAEWICLTLYGFAKVLITFFLIERVHIVLGNGKQRRKSKLYLGNMCLMLGWLTVVIVLLIYRRSHIRPSDDSCMLASAPFGDGLAAGVDIVVDVYLGLCFAIPLYRGQFTRSRIRNVAIKSILVAGISMGSSVANLLTNSVLHGSEMSSLCLTVCCLDTLINASGVFALTSGDSSQSSSDEGSRSQSRAPPILFRGSKHQTTGTMGSVAERWAPGELSRIEGRVDEPTTFTLSRGGGGELKGVSLKQEKEVELDDGTLSVRGESGESSFV